MKWLRTFWDLAPKCRPVEGVALRVALPATKIFTSRRVCSREALTELIDPSVISHLHTRSFNTVASDRFL